ncbi:hypothetical protein [Bordetella genomosp. 7]|uniref:Uncharacterized protein n=1 Tax=Bordetella genomosp. 7 TaxID=1416805 RepID=A0A261QZY3_9BORD|nr:hypothetical protein [Bordetella genomosp. 7]OZI17920.1 hypothetical protein CAL19_12620 [Bordetella genomosp. 7]
MDPVYAFVGENFQYVGGDQPAGSIVMQAQRPYDHYVAAADGSWVEPAPPAPQEVTAAQGGIALINAGLMPAVQAAVDDPETPAEVRWAWERATAWSRTSPALAYLADKAGISSEQMDDLFEAAALIEA